jgi:cysteine desulfurase/selenocysteine lyase
LIGNPGHRVGSISLVMEGIEPQALGKFLDTEGIAVRSSHHCAQPALAHYGLTETVRPSLAFYNTQEEIDALVHALHKARRELSA